MLSNRLKEIANMVETDNRVIDVGCDHALLGIYLLKEKIVSSVLSIDINENSIKTAKENKKKYLMEGIDKKHTDKLKEEKMLLFKNLEIMQNNGLKDIVIRKTDDVVISGMGTKTIIDILENSDLKKIKTLIIQSNNNLYDLRKFVISKGFLIDNEFVVFEKGIYYVIIKFKRADKKEREKKENQYSFSDLYFGRYTKRYKGYMDYVVDNLKEIYFNIPYKNLFKKIKYLILIFLARKRKK